MDMLVLPLAALAVHAPLPVAIARAAPTEVRAAVAQRSAGGAESSATVTVRIISSSARLSAGAPPVAGMVPRAAVIAAADGSPVAALIYDFE